MKIATVPDPAGYRDTVMPATPHDERQIESQDIEPDIFAGVGNIHPELGQDGFLVALEEANVVPLPESNANHCPGPRVKRGPVKDVRVIICLRLVDFSLAQLGIFHVAQLDAGWVKRFSFGQDSVSIHWGCFDIKDRHLRASVIIVSRILSDAALAAAHAASHTESPAKYPAAAAAHALAHALALAAALAASLAAAALAAALAAAHAASLAASLALAHAFASFPVMMTSGTLKM